MVLNLIGNKTESHSSNLCGSTNNKIKKIMIAALAVKIIYALLIAEIILWLILVFIHRNDDGYNRMF